MSEDSARPSAGVTQLFVACHSDVRSPTVAAHSPSKCAEMAVKQFDLRHSLRDMSEWNRLHDTKNAIEGRRTWRIRMRSKHQEYVAIHEVSVENGRYSIEGLDDAQ